MSTAHKDITQQAHLWLVTMQDQPLTPKQRREFEQWLSCSPDHTIAFAEAELMWNALGSNEVKETLAPLSATPEQAEGWFARAARKLKELSLVPVASTAMLLGALAFTAWLNLPQTPAPASVLAAPVSYQTQAGQQRQLTLSDGSQVTLAAGSHIQVEMNEKTRRVTLDYGSAFFDVSHDKTRPFNVYSGAVAVTVTGTEFDVQRKQNAVYVAVEAGSVEVSQPLPGWKEHSAIKNNQPWQRHKGASLSKVSLSAGEKVKGDRVKGLGAVESVPAIVLGAWRKGKLIYINKPLLEIVEDINRYSQIPVRLAPNAAELKVSGTFNSGDIPGMLDSLVAALPLSIEKEPHQINMKLNSLKVDR